MKRWTYLIEDLTTRESKSCGSMKEARSAAKDRSLKTGHAVAVIAVDTTNQYEHHKQGTYYGRTWRGGAY